MLEEKRPYVHEERTAITSRLAKTIEALRYDRMILGRRSNDEVERRGIATATNEADLSRSSTHSLAHRRCYPAIARTDG